MTPALNHEAIHALLSHFRELPPERIDQEHGILYRHNRSGSLMYDKCACIGANAVMALDYPPSKGKYSGVEYWSFADADRALGRAYALSPDTLIQRLVQLGAPIQPFDEDDWQVYPYGVFEKLYQQRCQELGVTPA